MSWFQVHRRRDGHAGTQPVLGILPRIEHDLHRHTLYHLDEVAGGVLRRQQAEAGAGRTGDAVDLAGVLTAVRVHRDHGALAGARALVAVTCDGPVCAVCISACARSSPARACASLLSATRRPASASATCERADSAAAFCASAVAAVVSNICCETSSLASRP